MNKILVIEFIKIIKNQVFSTIKMTIKRMLKGKLTIYCVNK